MKSNQKLKILFIVISAVSIFMGCRPKPIDVAVKPSEEKLVVFSQVVPDRAMIITLSKTFSPLNNASIDDLEGLLVSDPNAQVNVYFKNQQYHFTYIRPGVFASQSATPFEAGEEYELVIESGGQKVTSRSIMLPKVQYQTALPRVDKTTKDSIPYLKLRFVDPTSTKNWYVLNVFKKQNNQILTDYSNYFSNGSNALIKTILVSDQEFDGTYSTDFKMENVTYKDSIAVTLSNISENYYNYLSFRVGNSGVLNQLNVEPINYPTNIENGFGFFNTHSPDVHFFDLKNF